MEGIEYRQKVADKFRWLIGKESGWQYGEQGVLSAVCRALDDQPKTCVEFGAGNGRDLPVAAADQIKRGWRARLIEADKDSAASLAEKYPRAEVVNEKVTPDTIGLVDDAFDAPATLVVVDVDGDDIKMVEAMRSSPAVFMVEHWDEADPSNPREASVPADLGVRSPEGFTKEANSAAVGELLAGRGYVPVWSGRVNAVYVRSDLADRLARRDITPDGPVRLNIGGGETEIEGFINVDRRFGLEAYPLPYPDGVAEEVRASHILEHFPYAITQDVVNEWVRVLKPGGRLQIAVPDFAKCIEVYRNERRFPIPVEKAIFGGQIDENDFHKAQFDYGGLFVVMQRAGLVGIDRWTSDIEGEAASLDISLNLEGYKPTTNLQAMSRKTRAVMSVPRIIFTDTAKCCEAVFGQLQIPWDMETGAFWGQCLERAMERTISRNDGTEYILAVDYDTIFDANVLGKLFMLMDKHPEIDAIAPLQVGRGRDFMLVASDKPAERSELIGPLFDATMAHFGCTLIRVSALKKMPHPWFIPVPNKDGRWGDGRTDDDVQFWKSFKAAGNRLAVATRVSVGHIQSVISWPTEGMGVLHQYMDQYNNYGPPNERRH
jgi:SAM-dependent methyltransferase